MPRARISTSRPSRRNAARRCALPEAEAPDAPRADSEAGRLPEHEQRERRQQSDVAGIAEQRPEEHARRAGTRPRGPTRRTNRSGMQTSRRRSEARTGRSCRASPARARRPRRRSSGPDPCARAADRRAAARARRARSAGSRGRGSGRSRTRRRSRDRRTRRARRRHPAAASSAAFTSASASVLSSRRTCCRSTSRYGAQQLLGPPVQRYESGVLHAIPALELADQQLRVGADLDTRPHGAPRRPRARGSTRCTRRRCSWRRRWSR